MTVNNSRLGITLTLLVGCLLMPIALPVQEASAQEKIAEETWKVSLKNADIREFVTQVSVITGKSFVVDPRVKGNVTVISNASMDKDTIYELFLSVLRVHGYAAVPTGNITKIVQQVLAKQSGNPKDFLTPSRSEELVTAVIPVRNSPSEDLVKILRPLIPQYGHVAGIASPNVLIISDHSENIARLTEIVERIDIADNQTVEIVSLKEAWVEDMVGLLEQLAPDQIGKGAKGPNRVTIVASERTNSMVIKGERVTVERGKAASIPTGCSGESIRGPPRLFDWLIPTPLKWLKFSGTHLLTMRMTPPTRLKLTSSPMKRLMLWSFARTLRRCLRLWMSSIASTYVDCRS